jgi:hypothetical protein
MIVGITGHQDLDAAIDWCRDRLEELVVSLPVTHGYTCLAAGADQLFAEVLLRRAIPFTAVIPCEQYESAFASSTARERYAALLAAAQETIALPYAQPSEAAFMAAGQRLAESVDALIAIWDGEKARGLGGTADIVAYAQGRGSSVVQCNPKTRSVERL